MSALLTATAGATRLAHDDAVPFREAMLDGDVVGAHLAARAGIDGPLEITGCDCVHARYRAGRSLRAAYRLRFGDREQWVAARTMPFERADRAVRKGLPGSVPAGPLRPIVHVPELGAVFWAFPNDRKIDNLRVLSDDVALARLCGRSHVRAQVIGWAAEALAAAAPASPAAAGWLHGDPHPSNVLVDGERIGLIDLDLAARGPVAAADPALVLAGLRQERLVGRIGAGDEAALAERLLAGYRSVRPLPDHLAWHMAAWLLARPALPGAVAGTLRPGALSHLPALIVQARALLADGGIAP